MAREWTLETAQNYIRKVQNGKQQMGLTYCSAIDFVTKAIAEKEKSKNVAKSSH